MEVIEVYVVVWHLRDCKLRPIESEHFYSYVTAQDHAQSMLDDMCESQQVAYYRIEKRFVLR